MITKGNGTDKSKQFLEALIIVLVIAAFFIGLGIFHFNLINLINPDKPTLIKTTFKYGQYVQVTDGFYAGKKAKVMEEGIAYIDCYRTYKIRFDDSLAGEAVVCNHKLKAIEEVK